MAPLTQMMTFAKVVELASFSAAAKALGLTKSTASKHVTDLEQRLGVRLLARTSRKVEPTEAGRQFQERCAELIAGAEDAVASTTALGSAVRGTLRVFAPSAFGRAFLSPILGDFLDRYPDIDLHFLYADRPVDLVGERFDVAIQLMALPDSSQKVRRIGEMQRHLCASASYLDAHGEPRSPEDLREHQCLVQSDTLAPGVWRLRSAHGEVSVKVRGRVRANSSEALLELMVRGHGIGHPPTFATLEGRKSGMLRVVLPEWSGSTMPIFAVSPPGRSRDPKTSAFVDFLVERFQGATWEPAMVDTDSASRPKRSR